MRFYAACLASYNSGVLHGRWIDASSDVDEMQEEISAMLRESKFPNVRVECPDCEGSGKPHGSGDGVCETCGGSGEVPSAEEWAIHDYEDMPITLGEYPGIQAIADYMEFVEAVEDRCGDCDGLAQAMLENWHDVKAATTALDNFLGVYDTFRDYADEFADELLHDAAEFARQFFDYDAFARYLKMDYTVLDLPDGREAIFHD